MIEMQEQNLFYVKGKDGIPMECEALFRYESGLTGKSILAFTDGSTDEDGNVKVYASYTLDPIGTVFPRLLPIEQESEWNLIEKIFQAVQSGCRDAMNNGANEDQIIEIIEERISNLPSEE